MSITLYFVIGVIVSLILSYVDSSDYDDMVIYAFRFIVFAAFWPVFLIGTVLKFVIRRIKFGG